MRYDFNDRERERIDAMREAQDAIGLFVAGAVVALLAVMLIVMVQS